MKFETEMEVVNSLTRQIKLYLEPWGEELEMPAGTRFLIIATANSPGEFEIEESLEGIYVYAWSGSTVKVTCDSLEISGERPIVPEIPAGFKMSSFLNFMFGKKAS